MKGWLTQDDIAISYRNEVRNEEGIKILKKPLPKCDILLKRRGGWFEIVKLECRPSLTLNPMVTLTGQEQVN